MKYIILSICITFAILIFSYQEGKLKYSPIISAPEEWTPVIIDTPINNLCIYRELTKPKYFDYADYYLYCSNDYDCLMDTIAVITTDSLITPDTFKILIPSHWKIVYPMKRNK